MLKTRFIALLSIALITVSAGANVALVRQNAALRTHLVDLRAQLQVTLNVPMPALVGTSTSGSPLNVSVTPPTFAKKTRSTLLVVLSPTCGFCTESWVYWQQILKTHRSLDKWDMVFANIGPPLDPSYVERHGISSYTVFDRLSAETLLGYRLYSTPQTLLIDSSGRVRQLWKGSLGPDTTAEIKRMLVDTNSGESLARNK